MKSATISLPIPNSLLILRNSQDAVLPEVTRGGSVWATESCITLSCLPDFEGETRIRVAAAPEVDKEDKPLFEGELDTPNRLVLVQIVPGKIILECRVDKKVTRVRIWTDGQPDTKRVTIGME